MTPKFRDLVLLLACRPDRAAAIAWWRLTGKRVRARYRLSSAIADLPFAHQRWIEACGQEDLAALRDISDSDAGQRGTAPAICVHLHIRAEDIPRTAQRAAASALRQSVMPLKLIVTNSAADMPLAPKPNTIIVPQVLPEGTGGLHQALVRAQEEGAAYLVPLAANVLLPRHALAAYAAYHARMLSSDRSLPILYGDQDEAGRSGVGTAPWLKPEWDPRMLLSQDYVGTACALPVAAALRCFQEAGDRPVHSLYELILRLTQIEAEVRVSHVPRITARTAAGDWRHHGQRNVATVARVADARAITEPGPFGTVRVHWPLPDPAPKVSIVVATRDRVELLRTCIDGLLNSTDYPDFEVIIADNDSRDREALEYMDAATADPRVSVVRWPHPFNYSAINNFAASFATGRFLCLLNNDIEVLEPHWLTELVREGMRPGTGAVGARLLYPDRSIQHAGVAIGLGNAAGHPHRALPEGEPGYFAQASIARGASAVTGACLLVEKRHFEAVGGLDEEWLAVAYNDVDLCLKLRDLGLSNIYTPEATLIHHESKSRGLDFAPEHLERYMRELAAFQDRWGTRSAIDPWHHPRLDRASEIYRVGGVRFR